MQPSPIAKLGPTHLDDGACHETIAIDIADETASSGYWFGKIQVHGDLALPQRLVDFPNQSSNAALTQLKDHQQQIDADGAMVGVSRQALEEVLAVFS
jgi:hypothetical protein